MGGHTESAHILFIKEKREGTMKARGCTDGRPQHQYTQKEDTSSPTMGHDDIMLHRCKRKLIPHSNRHPGGIPPCRHEGHSTHGIGRDTS